MPSVMALPNLPSVFAALPHDLQRLLLTLPGDDLGLRIDTDWLVRNVTLLYPLLALGTLALLGLGILAAWRTDDLSGEAKTEFKRLIISTLRRELGGLTVERLAKQIRLHPLRTAALVEEMDREGVLASDSRGGKSTTWRLKGVSSR